MRKYVLMGPQGCCGKGTEARLLARDHDRVHVSAGDVFRGHVQSRIRLRSSWRWRQALILAGLVGCGGGEGDLRPTPLPSATPTPDPATVVTPTLSSGPTQIAFVSSMPPPGSTTAGCGPDVAGCRGHLTMTFRLRSAAGGEVLFFSVFLHSPRLIACLSTVTEGFELRPGASKDVEVVFDRADACATPVDLVTMDAAAEGAVAIASRQEWALRYTLAP